MTRIDLAVMLTEQVFTFSVMGVRSVHCRVVRTNRSGLGLHQTISSWR
jgi:hypothetical protein